jgi:quinol monooxygenase YgiN
MRVSPARAGRQEEPMAESLRVVARITARPDTVDEVKALLGGLIEPTRKETGCITYELLQNRQEPTDFTFVEEWDGDASLDAHLASDHLSRALPRLQQLVTVPPDIRRYTLVG